MKTSLIMRRILLPIFLLVTLVISTANRNAKAQSAGKHIYTGTATTTVQLSNIYGASKGTFSYKTPVEIVFSLPKKSLSNMSETNPFGLWLQSKPLANAPGEISIASALPANGTLFQYWQFTGDNKNWQGLLTANHTNSALALNLITLPKDIAPNLEMPYPEAMAYDTKMVGQGDSTQIKIIIEGNSTGGSTPVRTEIIARLTQ